MKKILIATTALAAMTATSAFALTVKAPSGAIEYRYNKSSQYDAAAAASKSKNPSLDQKTAEVKFNAEGMSNGLGYGAWVKIKSEGGANNNAKTQSAMWVSGSFGKIIAGEDGSAAGSLKLDGKVKAADYGAGTSASSAIADAKETNRVTYMIPSVVDGLSAGYTTSFKGNVDKTTANKAKASTNWGVKYATNVSGVALAVSHVEGTTSSRTVSGTKTHSKSGTITGMTATYGNFTVGYGMFDNDKEKGTSDTKGKSGNAWGVKYGSGAWAVGYTVESSENKNVTTGTSIKSADTSAYSVSYKIADGFSTYASKSSNSAKQGDGKTQKNSYTIIGAKISF